MSSPVPAALDGERLDRVVAVTGGMSRADARRLIDSGDATLDGVAAKARTRVKTGQLVDFSDAPPPPELAPEPVEFRVAHEDDHLLVISKPPGLVVHPGAGQQIGTLAAGVLHRYPQVAGVGEPGRWGIVHRLDRDTSGLMLVAFTSETHRALSGMISRREVARNYLALVDGLMDTPTGTIDAPIARDPARPTRRKAEQGGKHARTHYTVVREFEEAEVTLLEVRLETGRTHQIRVHLAAIDHPLAGDGVYRRGPDRIEVPRLFLHSHRIGFTHPVTGEALEFEDPLPEDLARVVARLGQR